MLDIDWMSESFDSEKQFLNNQALKVKYLTPNQQAEYKNYMYCMQLCLAS